jgi:hypothetical protein
MHCNYRGDVNHEGTKHTKKHEVSYPKIFVFFVSSWSTDGEMARLEDLRFVYTLPVAISS